MRNTKTKRKHDIYYLSFTTGLGTPFQPMAPLIMAYLMPHPTLIKHSTGTMMVYKILLKKPSKTPLLLPPIITGIITTPLSPQIIYGNQSEP